jgi:hypothetical protein
MLNNSRRFVGTIVVIVVLSCVMTARQARADSTASGVVVSAAGQPVEGAEVIVATPKLPARPNLMKEELLDEGVEDEHSDAGVDDRRGAATALTDKSGRFTVKLPDGAGLLSVAHPKSGYAQVKPDALGENADPIKLEPWCRVEGTVKLGAKPAPAGTKVTLGTFYAHPDACAVHYGYESRTDDKGRYTLDRVPAGMNQIRVKLSKTGSPLEQYVGAEPDKPAHLDIGGRGRPVTGKVVLVGHDMKELSAATAAGASGAGAGDGGAADGKSRRLISQSHFRRDVPWPKPPYFESGAQTPQERQDALAAWRRTPEAIEQWKDQYRHTIEFQPDGSYRFDDVPPGKYFLTLTIYAREDNRRMTSIAQQRVEVVVPETPAVPTDEPLDLGEQRFEPTEPGKEGL